MINQSLNGKWLFKKTDEEKWLEASVPGSVCNDLLNHKMIPDPFFGENEYTVLDLLGHDYEYKYEFSVDSDLYKEEHIFLLLKGVDTLSEVFLNNNRIGETKNMHRSYEFDIKPYLKKGMNSINIRFKSAINHVHKMHQTDPIWSDDNSSKGMSHLRKAHYMFGWDWGPKLPDMGIWRDISIVGYSNARLKDCYVTQEHHGDSVELNIKSVVEGYSSSGLKLSIDMVSPDGEHYIKEVLCLETTHVNLTIINPQLWWPNNMGEQALYKMNILLLNGNKVLDQWSNNIGLRTLTVRQEKDEWGESFEFSINGQSIFAMGGDYVPEDNILSRTSYEKTEKLILSCVEANMNSIRVWGGAFYPEDYFYDLCDQHGLIVWQDLMFACALYRMTDEFTENIEFEVRENVRRLRHHASLGLWCGNNEMEMAILDWDGPRNSAQDLKSDYVKQFEFLLPQWLKEEDPETFYWKASPSSGGHFDDPNSEDRGDVHDWSVWHGLEPFEYFQDHYYRFLSEFGLQSFPNIKTLEAVTKPEDRNIFGAVMENHQKNKSGNGKIMFYISDHFKYPETFENLLYKSQLIQAMGIQFAVEHLRRHRGRCMGAIYWQLNDCWPVASWSSIDYFGRWKALHYFAKKFFNPLLISIKAIKTKPTLNSLPSEYYYPVSESNGGEITLTNDTNQIVEGIVRWSIKDNESKVIQTESIEVLVEAFTSKKVLDIDASQHLLSREEARSQYLIVEWLVDGEVVSSNNIAFVRYKHFDYLKPTIKQTIIEEDECFVITLTSDVYTKFTELSLKGIDGIFSDNYFDLEGHIPRIIICKKNTLSQQVLLKEFINELEINMLNG